jgi:REP element-mobilizing transposase RayT
MRAWKSLFAVTDRWLDTAPAARHLADERLASAVRDALYFFAGVRYELLAFTVMPSHFHWVFRPTETWERERETRAGKTMSPRERIMHSVQLRTARVCNRLLGRNGAFWQHETYDHCVRDEDELLRIIEYIDLNPVKAGLCRVPDVWQFSSAYDRVQLGLRFPQPLALRPGTAG